MEGLNKQQEISPAKLEVQETRETKIIEADKNVTERFENELGNVLNKIRKNPYFYDLSERKN